jgi:Peptidase family M28
VLTGSLEALVGGLAAHADQDRMRADVEALAVGQRSRRWAITAMRAAEDHVLAGLAATGWRVEVQPFRAPLRVGSNDSADLTARLLRVRPYRGLAGVNLVARRPASPVGPAIVVGAHLDTVRNSPGADDNASGVAVVLEVARLLATLPEPPAVVLAVFDLEELGLVGASAVARKLAGEGAVAGMIGLESVGYFSSEPGSQRLPAGARLAFPGPASAIAAADGRGDFTLVVHRRSSGAAAATWEAAAAYAGHRAILLRDPRRDGVAGTLSTVLTPQTVHLSRSDHAAFWRRGVPAMMLTDTASFRNPAYHRAGDLPETLDYRRLAEVAVATAATALTWAAAR